jgi:hypothetical protein
VGEVEWCGDRKDSIGGEASLTLEGFATMTGQNTAQPSVIYPPSSIIPRMNAYRRLSEVLEARLLLSSIPVRSFPSFRINNRKAVLCIQLHPQHGTLVG